MILRRFMKHVTEQNWFAVGLDVLVVITGIFLGMQVTEWNDARKEKSKEITYLIGLDRDFTESIQLLSDELKDNRVQSDYTAQLIGMTTGRLKLPQPKEMHILVHQGLFQYGRLEMQLATRNELITNGTITVLQDLKLRDGLINLDALIKGARFRAEDVSTLVLDKIDPYLIQHYVVGDLIEFEFKSADINKPNPFAGQKVSDVLHLLENQQFQNLLAYRHMFQSTMISSFDSLLKEFIRLQNLTRARLKAIQVNN